MVVRSHESEFPVGSFVEKPDWLIAEGVVRWSRHTMLDRKIMVPKLLNVFWLVNGRITGWSSSQMILFYEPSIVDITF